MKIFITADFSNEGIRRLTDAGHDVSHCCWDATHEICSEEKLAEKLQGFDVLLVGYEPVQEKILKSTNLKIICSIRGDPGINIDVGLATRMNIPVIYLPGCIAVSVADFTIGQIIGLVRQIVKTDRELRSGKFTASARTYNSSRDAIPDISLNGHLESGIGIDLAGKTLGLLGFGTTGREVARRAIAFGMKVIAHDPFQRDSSFVQYRIEKVTLDVLCRRSDIISIHARGTEKNKGMIGEKEFAIMKQGVYLINNAAAAIVDEKAMRDSIYSEKVAGAALDVFHNETIRIDDPLLKMDNIIVTPHIAGAGFEIDHRHSNMLCDDFFALLQGEMPKAIINPEAIDDFNRFKELGKQVSAGSGTRLECAGCSKTAGYSAEKPDTGMMSQDIIARITEEVLKQIKQRIS
jgi:D-3-phosphoglycerate dehydrogenase / 2-oxoglutarate reductase